MNFLEKFSALKNNIFGKKIIKEIGLDLGTSNTVFYVKGEGIRIDEPTYVSRNIKTEEIDKLGSEAKKISGREPNYIEIIRPLKNGVISNYELTLKMLETYFKSLVGDEKVHSKVVVGVPSSATQVEKKSVFNVVLDAGAKEVYLVDEPIAAAIGAGIDIFEPKGHLIVNIGAGTTEIAFISSGGTSKSKSIKVAGDHLNEDIVEFIREQYAILVGHKTAEELKIKATANKDSKKTYEIRGIGTGKGLPKSLEISGKQVDTAIEKDVNTIVDNVKIALEEIEPEISADIYETGIYLSGGGANIHLIKDKMEKEFNLKVTVAEDSIHAVINGIAKILDDFDNYKNILVTESLEY